MFQLSAQNISITLYQNSIKLQNDTLFFKYSIQNNSDSTIVLFNTDINHNINNLNLDLLADTVLSKSFLSRLSALITKEGSYPPRRTGSASNWSILVDSIKVRNNDFYFLEKEYVYEPSKEEYFYESSEESVDRPKEKYIVLFPYSHEEFSDNLSLRDTIWASHDTKRLGYYFYSIELTKGVHEFQLYYFSSKYFERDYINAKRRDIRLKDSFMFEGIIESNVCYFTYP